MGSRTGWQLVLAERADGTRHIVDYGPFDIPSDEMPIEDAFVCALRELAESIGPGWAIANSGDVRTVDQIWYDAGYKTDAVLQHVHDWAGMSRQSPHIASYGRGVTFFEKANYAAPKKTGNEVREIDPKGLYYVAKVKRAKTLAVYWDGDITKWQVQQALTLPIGTPGSITLLDRKSVV